jgi:hypothetical protein
MFNGRLNKNESDIWLDLHEETSKSMMKDRQLAKHFLALPESISFVSSVEKQIIGGTTIYRDRTRLSMVLVSVAVKEPYRESATYQIVKSSLPFFKTVAIRDVDVLMSMNGGSDNVGFPLSLEVDPWAAGAIMRAGFDEVAKIGQHSFEITKEHNSRIKWDDDPNIEGAKELIWDQGKPLGLTNSLVWLARDFATEQRTLVTSTVNNKVNAVVGLWKFGESLTVSPIVTNPEVLDWSQVAKAIVSEGARLIAKSVHLPIVGQGQSGLIEELERLTNLTSSRKLSLLRKPI